MATAAQIQTTDPHITTAYFDQSVYLNIKMLLNNIKKAASTELAKLQGILRASIPQGDTAIPAYVQSGTVRPLDAYAIAHGAPATRLGAWSWYVNKHVPAGKYSVTSFNASNLPMLVSQLTQALNQVHLPPPPELAAWVAKVQNFLGQSLPPNTKSYTYTPYGPLAGGRSGAAPKPQVFTWPNGIYYAMIMNGYNEYASLFNWIPALQQKVNAQAAQALKAANAAAAAAAAQAKAASAPSTTNVKTAVQQTTQAVQTVKQAAAQVAANNSQAPASSSVSIQPSTTAPTTGSKVPIIVVGGLLAAKALGFAL